MKKFTASDARVLSMPGEDKVRLEVVLGEIETIARSKKTGFRYKEKMKEGVVLELENRGFEVTYVDDRSSGEQFYIIEW